MYKFKVGDRVRVIDNEELNILQKKYIGKTGVVRENNENPWVKMDCNGESHAFHQDKLELIREEKQMENPKINQLETLINKLETQLKDAKDELALIKE